MNDRSSMIQMLKSTALCQSKKVHYKNSIPSDLQASKQSSEKVFGCRSWTDLQDLVPVNQSREHYNHPQHRTISHLEFQLQKEKMEWPLRNIKTWSKLLDTKMMLKNNITSSLQDPVQLWFIEQLGMFRLNVFLINRIQCIHMIKFIKAII